jgi:hypothetical protein
MTWLWSCNNVLCSWVSSKVLPICLRVHFPITSLCSPSTDTIHLKMSTVVVREKHLPLFPHSLSSVLLLLTRLSWFAWHCITVVISLLWHFYDRFVTAVSCKTSNHLCLSQTWIKPFQVKTSSSSCDSRFQTGVNFKTCTPNRKRNLYIPRWRIAAHPSWSAPLWCFSNLEKQKRHWCVHFFRHAVDTGMDAGWQAILRHWIQAVYRARRGQPHHTIRRLSQLYTGGIRSKPWLHPK